MKVAVLGLGEAGSRLAADLVRAGDEVHGYDPAEVAPIEGVQLHATPREAVVGCDLVLAVTHSSRALGLATEVAGHLGPGAVYADLSTGSPGLKGALSETLTRVDARFVDVALMAPVPGRGLATPALASGPGAEFYADAINTRGGRVEVVGDRAGAAATRKLLRSVVTKGLAALLIESTTAADRAGQGSWFWTHLVEQLGSIDEPLMKRFIDGSAEHAGRRLEEMEAARDLITELGVAPLMTTATIEHLRHMTREHPGSMESGTPSP